MTNTNKDGIPWIIREAYLDTPILHPQSLYKRRSLTHSLAWSYADVITKFSRLDGLPIFITHGALLHTSSPITVQQDLTRPALTTPNLTGQNQTPTPNLIGPNLTRQNLTGPTLTGQKPRRPNPTGPDPTGQTLQDQTQHYKT